jgi:ribosome biogenesis protein YTM1
MLVQMVGDWLVEVGTIFWKFGWLCLTIDEATNQKRAKTEDGNTSVPQMALEGHKETVSAVQWIDNSSILTSSWDHTLKIWDLSMNEITKAIPGNKSFFDFHYSNLNGLIITAFADKNLKLYDTRSNRK